MIRNNPILKGVSMKRKLWIITFCIVSLMAATLCLADEAGQKGKAILEKTKDAVLQVKVVVKSGVSYSGRDSNKTESSSEVTGTVIDPSGLMILSLSDMDPSAIINQYSFGEEGEEESIKFQSEIKDVKIIQTDGKEIPATVVLRDKDLDMAFIKPQAKQAKPFNYIDLTQAGKPEILDELVFLNRLGRVANRTMQVSLDRVEAIVEKPRTFYLPGRAINEGGLGSPVFTLDGKIVGILLLRLQKTDGRMGIGSLFGGSSGLGIMPMVLPAEDILEAVKQIPATDTTAKSVQPQK
jgi:S1-C subfamily serine protease